MTELTIAIAYLAVMNLFTFILFGIDKYLARKKRPRIRNFTLFFFSALGGSLGGFLGMFVFRHKTTKIYYLLGIPLILVLQIVLVFYLFNI